MIKLRKRKATSAPEMMLSPMIDMIFLLLVFFILSTMYMSELKTIPVRLPIAQNTQTQLQSKFNVTIKGDGAFWLENNLISRNELIAKAKEEYAKNKDFAVIIRADGDVNYKTVIELLDSFKTAGISKIGLAADSGESKK